MMPSPRAHIRTYCLVLFDSALGGSRRSRGFGTVRAASRATESAYNSSALRTTTLCNCPVSRTSSSRSCLVSVVTRTLSCKPLRDRVVTVHAPFSGVAVAHPIVPRSDRFYDLRLPRVTANIAGPGPCLGTWDANPHSRFARHHPQTRPHRVHEVADDPTSSRTRHGGAVLARRCVDSLAGSLSTVDLAMHPVYCPVR